MLAHDHGASVVNRLRQAEGGWVTHRELLDVMYADREDGGPLIPRSVLLRVVQRLRRLGFPIENWCGQGYRYRTGANA